MLTGLLKTFLYSVLVLILLWALAIFLGPSTIKYVAHKYYGDKINLVGLKVSPRLNIYAARIEFDNLLLPNNEKRSGYVRAASLSLKNYRKRILFFELSTGPIEIYDLAKVSNTSTEILIKDFSALDEMALIFSINEVENQENFFLDRLNGSGKVNLNNNNITEIVFEAEGIINNFMERLSLQKASGQIGRIDFNQPVERSVSNFSVTLENPVTRSNILSLENVLVKGDLSHEVQRLDINLNGLEFLDNVIANFISFKGLGNNLIKDRTGLFSYTANGINLSHLEKSPLMGSVRQISGEIDVRDYEKISLDGLGRFENLELIVGSQYIADLSDTLFDIDLKVNQHVNNIQIESDFSIDISTDPVVTFDGDFAITLPGQSLVGCAISGCRLGETILDYNFMAGDTSLIGSSVCVESKCSLDDFHHSIKTSDTQKFFLGLIASKVFNPLALIAAQAQIQQGVGVGAGHELKF